MQPGILILRLAKCSSPPIRSLHEGKSLPFGKLNLTVGEMKVKREMCSQEFISLRQAAWTSKLQLISMSIKIMLFNSLALDRGHESFN